MSVSEASLEPKEARLPLNATEGKKRRTKSHAANAIKDFTVILLTVRVKDKRSAKLLLVKRMGGDNGLKFTAKITIKGVRNYLGVFDTEELAYAAYLVKKRESHEGNIL